MSNLIPTVFVVDADPLVRTALGMLLRRAGWKTEPFACIRELRACGRPSAPGCMMLDLAAPNPDALSDLQRIASDRRETPVIATSNHGSIAFAVQAIRAGAVEFLVKPLVDDVVLTAAARAIRQSESILQKEAELIQIRTRYESLSQREREVLARVVAGELNKKVGAALGISEITVKAHRGRVMRKMRADSLADLVRMAIRLRIPPAPASPAPAFAASRVSQRVAVSGGRMSQPIRIMPAASSQHFGGW